MSLILWMIFYFVDHEQHLLACHSWRWMMFGSWFETAKYSRAALRKVIRPHHGMLCCILPHSLGDWTLDAHHLAASLPLGCNRDCYLLELPYTTQCAARLQV